MDGTAESRRRIQRMREKARELAAEAEAAKDAGERRRLQEEVRRLEFATEQESMMAAGDIYPTQ